MSTYVLLIVMALGSGTGGVSVISQEFNDHMSCETAKASLLNQLTYNPNYSEKAKSRQVLATGCYKKGEV